MRLLTILLLVVAFAGCSISTHDRKAKQCAYSDHRLPKHITPSNYDLSFDLDLVRSTYKGAATIELSVNGEPDGVAWNVIVLHAAPTLDINEVVYRANEGEDHLEIVDTCRDEENELLVVTLKDDLARGARGQLSLSFGANIRTDAKGIYRSDFTKPDGYKDHIVSTQFEATEARKAFPCFDEPSFKATFDVTLTHNNQNKSALANTAVDSEVMDVATQLRTTKFKTTPLMSTYLLAFVVGELDFVEKKVANGRIRVRAYARQGKAHLGQFALDTAARAIILLEDYFDIPFPLEKIDLVAIPEFADGKAAMENWGLITYAESGILFDEIASEPSSKGYISIYVAHEMAHQWFGNLVTMKWWNDLWLNEGFAAWMENFLANQLYPEFNVDLYNQADTRQPALAADTQLNTHPVIFEHVGKNIDDIFDDIVYSKSSSIIKYINDVFVGPEQFKEGVRSYLKKNIYGNTEASDLWDELKAVSGLPVDEFMKSWLTQPGHPLVRVKLVGGKLKLEQERRWPKLDPHRARTEGEQTWIIPITVLVSDSKGRQERLSFTFDQKTMEAELPSWFESSNKDHWLVLNEEASGFYRTFYDDRLLKRLAKPCKFKQLGVYARANLIDELRSHYETGLIKVQKLQDCLSWFKDERAGLILINLAGAFQVAKRDTGGIIAKWQLDRLGKKLFRHIFAEHGLNRIGNDASLIEAIGQTKALSVLVSVSYEPLIREALDSFQDFFKGPSVLQDQRGLRIVSEAVVMHGTKAQKDRLRNIAHDLGLAAVIRMLDEQEMKSK